MSHLEEELTPEEEMQHAKRGGCIFLLLVLLVCPPATWAFFAYTSPGQVGVAHVMMLYSYYGIPITEYTQGFPDLARTACELDRTKPAGYQQRQAQLEERYQSSLETYQQYWTELRKLGRGTDIYENPEEIPETMFSAKRHYCEQQ